MNSWWCIMYDAGRIYLVRSTPAGCEAWLECRNRLVAEILYHVFKWLRVH